MMLGIALIMYKLLSAHLSGSRRAQRPERPVLSSVGIGITENDMGAVVGFIGKTGNPVGLGITGARVLTGAFDVPPASSNGFPSITSILSSPPHVRRAFPAQGVMQVVLASVASSLRIELPHQHSSPLSVPAKLNPLAQHAVPQRSGVSPPSPPEMVVRLARVATPSSK